MKKHRMKWAAFILSAAVIVYATVKYPEAGVAAVVAGFALITEILFNAPEAIR